jgi:nucleotidyltransferase/DNA polymerase involved in DNA repair
MKVSVQLVVHPDDHQATPVVREVFVLDRDGLTPDTLGLRLAEAQDLLVAVQETMVEQQVQRAVADHAPCPHCSRARRHKDTRTITVRLSLPPNSGPTRSAGFGPTVVGSKDARTGGNSCLEPVWSSGRR